MTPLAVPRPSPRRRRKGPIHPALTTTLCLCLLLAARAVPATAQPSVYPVTIERIDDPAPGQKRHVQLIGRKSGDPRDTVSVEILYYGHAPLDPDLRIGQSIIVREDLDQPGEAAFAQYRVWPALAVLIALFIGVVWMVAAGPGMRGLAGSVFMLLCLAGGLWISLRTGLWPAATLAAVALASSQLSMMYLMRGQGRAKRLAQVSIAASFCATAAIGMAITKFLGITGTIEAGGRDLIYAFHTGQSALPPGLLWQLVAVGLPIAALGAMFDSAVVLSVSMDEMRRNQVPVAQLRASGLEIGRDLFSTLFLTLFFAHISLFAPLLAVAAHSHTPLIFMLNSEWMRVEIAASAISVFGLMTSVWVTSELAPRLLAEGEP